MENKEYEVQQAVNQALDEQKKKKRKKRLIIIGVILAVIVIGGVIGSSGGDEDNTTTKSQINAADSADSNDTTAPVIDADDSEQESKDGVIGDYACVVKSAKICKNWEGKDSVKITYTFTNNAKDAQSFDIALNDEVYQDGVQLESTFISSDDDDWGIDVKIKPGMSKDVSKVYILRDKTTDLEVEISELISFSDDKIVTTVKLEK